MKANVCAHVDGINLQSQPWALGQWVVQDNKSVLTINICQTIRCPADKGPGRVLASFLRSGTFSTECLG